MKKRNLVFLFVLAGALLSSPQKLHALLDSDIISRVRIYTKDQGTSQSRQQFTDQTLLSFINDGQREANAIGWLLQSSYTFVLTGGTTEYQLPPDFMATQRVLFKNIKLDQTSLNQLDADSAGWRTTAGTPNKYYVYLASTPVMGFFPAPTTTSTGTVIVYYVQQPLEMTLTTQTPFNGWTVLSPYHSGLIYYVVYRCYLVLEEPDLATQYLNEWLSFLQLLKTGVMSQPDFNPGFQGRRNQ